MGHRTRGSQQRWRRTALGVAFGLLATHAVATGAMAAGGNIAATITGSFNDSCRDFTTHATKIGSQQGKDISHVVIRYVDGRVVRDETIDSPDWSIDGDVGDEIETVTVKSGTTRETFACAGTNSPPTAILEVKTPESCHLWDDGLVACSGQTARTSWVHSTVPEYGYGAVSFFCSWPDDQSCVQHEMPCELLDFYSLCRLSYTFRGTSSTDPDDDIVSWSIDFGDGSSASGDWITNPPTEVIHEYLIHHCPTCTRDPATLTVTDSAGHTSTDAQFVYHEYPD